MKIGICIIAYNRINSLKRVLLSIENAIYTESVPLIISIDKSDTDNVEKYAYNYNWLHGEKRVITHTENLGLRKHVLKCGELLNEFDALIVLEDDVYVAENYFQYAKQCVENFKDNNNIAGISLYSFPINYHNSHPFSPLKSDSDIYLMQNAQSWGQVWMKNQWESFIEWYNLHNEEFSIKPHLPNSICSWPKSSWLKYHTRYCIECNKYFVYPYISLSTCFSEVGAHTNNTSTLIQTPLLYGKKEKYNFNYKTIYDSFFENEEIYKILNIQKDNLCIDFYYEKKNRQNKRFWLTRKILPYKIIKSYSLQLKPYELNIIKEIEGHELFLYDTTEKRNSIKVQHHEKLWEFYMYGINTDLKSCVKRLLKRLLHL